MSQDYVVGLAFRKKDPERDEAVLDYYGFDAVLCVLKLRGPDRVLNRYNGIGGKIEDGEEAIEAMVREFKEETGIDTSETSWRYFANLAGTWGRVFFFANYEGDLEEPIVSPTDEFVSYRPLDEPKLVDNLRWLIPLALDPTIRRAVTANVS